MNKELVSLREFGRRIGVSLSSVQKAVTAGRIYKEPNGKIDYKKQIENWNRNKDVSKVREQVNTKTDDDSTVPSFAKAKLAKETYTAKLRQIEYETASGKLIEKESAISSIQKFSRWVKDSIITIPDRVAAEEAARFTDYIKPLLIKKCGRELADEIILELDLSELEKIVHKSWNKESREVLTGLKEAHIKV
jgi:hypothetical protein